MDKRQWMVQIPIDDLLALYRAVEDHDKSNIENARLRREIDGLRNMQQECMMLLGDLRRQIFPRA